MKTLVVKQLPNDNLKLPCLMEHKSGLIVLMTDRKVCNGIGMVVRDSKMAKIGEYGEDWTLDNFKVFTGKLELSND